MFDFSRRKFMIGCSAATMLAMGAARVASSDQGFTGFKRTLLINGDGAPLTSQMLTPGHEYVFFYPYVSTPCFLLDLGKPTAAAVVLQRQDGRPYTWQGGIGPDRSVVAFSAICSHKLTHPAAAVSFIGYRQKPVGFLDENNRVQRRAAVIQCCSERSIYDPAQGAKVLSGPAPQPLAAIALKENQGKLYAQGVYGGELFDVFFERFGFRLAMEFGEDAVRKHTGDTAVVMSIDEYTRKRIQC